MESKEQQPCVELIFKVMDPEQNPEQNEKLQEAIRLSLQSAQGSPASKDPTPEPSEGIEKVARKFHEVINKADVSAENLKDFFENIVSHNKSDKEQASASWKKILEKYLEEGLIDDLLDPSFNSRSPLEKLFSGANAERYTDRIIALAAKNDHTGLLFALKDTLDKSRVFQRLLVLACIMYYKR